MTKTETRILARIREQNDRGLGDLAADVCDRTKGERIRWRGGRSKGPPKKADMAAVQSLLDSGVVERREGLLFVANHPTLANYAARVCLPGRARRVEDLRLQLEQAEADYESERQLLSRFWGAP